MSTLTAPFVTIGCQPLLLSQELPKSKIIIGKLFVVHPRIVSQDSVTVDQDEWSVTHKATGREICIARYGAALRIAAELALLEGWQDEPMIWPGRVGFFAAIREVVRRHGGRFDVYGRGVLGAGWVEFKGEASA